MAKAVHTMIRVRDLEQSMAFYKEALGLELAERFDFDDFTLAYLRNDESEYELELIPTAAGTDTWLLPWKTSKSSTAGFATRASRPGTSST